MIYHDFLSWWFFHSYVRLPEGTWWNGKKDSGSLVFSTKVQLCFQRFWAQYFGSISPLFFLVLLWTCRRKKDWWSYSIFFLESDLQPCLILFQPLGYGKILILPTGFEHGGEHSIFSSIFRQTTAHVFPMYFQCISTNKNPQYIHGYNLMSIPFSEPSSFELHRVEVAQEVVRALKKEVLSNV